MIDDKKIEEAAKSLRKDFDDDKTQGFLVEFGFEKGAKWAINEFLKDLWHSVNEEPAENSDIAYIDKNNEFWDIDNYNSDDFDDSFFGKGWKSACGMQGIYKWAYKDDLLPKKKKEDEL